uniref:Uncharacterized protein n=1 Tax=Romanomermis culicivorax TaxID=13658 RepID=A0A915J8S0_ROMCU
MTGVRIDPKFVRGLARTQFQYQVAIRVYKKCRVILMTINDKFLINNLELGIRRFQIGGNKYSKLPVLESTHKFRLDESSENNLNEISAFLPLSESLAFTRPILLSILVPIGIEI